MTLNSSRLSLSVITFQNPSKRKVFVKIWPVDAERRKLHVVELRDVPSRQPRIICDWETEFRIALHPDDDVSIGEERFHRLIG